MTEKPSHPSPEPVVDPGPDSVDLPGVQRREPEALDRFFQASFDRVYALSYRLTGDRTRAEDLAQEVFLRVYRFADTLDPARDPWPWLATITHRALADQTRRGDHRLNQRAISIDGQDGLAGWIQGQDAGPEGTAEAHEREAVVRRELARLPEEQRTVIVLRDWEGLSHREIAEITERSEVATRKLYSRALAALGQGLRRALG